MNNAYLYRLVSTFYKLAVDSEDLPDDSSDPDTVLKNLSSLETFKARVDYAEKNLTHLSSGSSRVVYIMPNDKEVLKLAKNDRGVAQNLIESKLKSRYINKTTKACPDGVWKLSPFLEKVTEKEFEKLSGMDFKEFGAALEYGLKDISGSSASKPNNFDEICKSDMYKDLVACGKKNKLMAGDLSRISSWGQVDDHPTLLDAGLTKEIFDEFYEKNSGKSSGKSSENSKLKSSKKST